MKTYVHARLTRNDQLLLEKLREETGWSDSELVRKGLALILREHGHRPSGLELAGKSVGKFTNGPKDLAANKRHLEGFGE